MPAMAGYRPTKLLPPVWFLASLIAMAALHFWLPVARLIPPPFHWLGLAPLIAGLALGFNAVGLFRRRQTGVVPFTPVTTLVTTGPYRFTRNPMYLGLVLALFGIATLLGTLSPWFVIPLFAAWIHRRFILQEEAMLEERFGDEYATFKQRVRRWI